MARVSQREWRDVLKRKLIEAGTVGVKQSVLTYDMRALVTASEIVAHLEMWEDQQIVQKFTMPSELKRGRPVTVWRATTLILSE